MSYSWERQIFRPQYSYRTQQPPSLSLWLK